MYKLFFPPMINHKISLHPANDCVSYHFFIQRRIALDLFQTAVIGGQELIRYLFYKVFNRILKADTNHL